MHLGKLYLVDFFAIFKEYFLNNLYHSTRTPLLGLALSTILDKINWKPRPHPPPKSKIGKWRVFALRAAPSAFICGGGGGGGGGDGGLLFHFNLSNIVGLTLPYASQHGTPKLKSRCQYINRTTSRSLLFLTWGTFRIYAAPASDPSASTIFIYIVFTKINFKKCSTEDDITLKGTLMISLKSGQSVLYLTDVWF